MRFSKSTSNNIKGFTLVEIIVVIGIIGILVGISSFSVRNYLERANEARIASDIKTVDTILESSFAANGETENSFEPVRDNKISKAVEESILYDISGKVVSSSKVLKDNNKLKVVPNFIVKNEAKSKLKGSFYVDNKSKVYYRDKEVIEGVKSLTISPDATWDTNKVLNSIKTMNANTVNIPIRVIVEDEKSNSVELSQEDINHAKHLIEVIRESDPDIKIIIEAFPWIKTGSVGETEWEPSDINLWFFNWFEDVIKPLAVTFNESPYEVEYLTVATNLANMEYASGYWSDLFKKTKSVFDGGVIYRTNWWITASWAPATVEAYNNKLNNLLFHDENLDYISIASYFELSEEEDPSIKQIKKDFKSTSRFNRNQNVYEEIKQFSKYTNKKIIFGELGTPKIDGFATEPWNNYYGSIKVNNDAHYKYFKAYLDTFWNEEWFEGFSIFLVGDEGSLYNITDNNAIKYIHNVK